MKNQVYAAGGCEMNFNASFKNTGQLKNYDAWRTSALIGVSKKYKITKKLQGEMKMMYDFLANRHIPVSQAFIIRMGYNF